MKSLEERIERLERIVFALAADSLFEFGNAGVEPDKYFKTKFPAEQLKEVVSELGRDIGFWA